MAGNQEKFQNAMNQGHSAAWDQMWDKAAIYYQQALAEFPEHPGALTSLALALFEQGDFDRSLVCYQKAVQVTPDDPMPFEKIGRIQERLGRLPEAIRTLLKAADLYLKNKEVDKAIECWKRITSLKPDHLNARTRLAMILERRGQKKEAVDEYLATASIMQHQGETQRALQVIEYCLQLVPEHPKAKNALALLNSNQLLPKPLRPRGGTGPVRMAQVKNMQEPQETVEKSQDPIEEARQKALIRMASLLFDQAEGAIEEKPSKRRDLTAITRGAGTQTLDQGRDGKALLYLGQAIDAQTHGDDNQTQAELEKAIHAGLSHPSVHFLLGWILTKKQSDKALRHLQSAFKHPDYALAAYLLIGQNYLAADNQREAASAYLHALSLADSATVQPEIAEEIRQLYEPIIESQLQQSDKGKLTKLCENIEQQLNRADWRAQIATIRKQMLNGDTGTTLPIAHLLLESSSHIIEGIAKVRALASSNNYYSAMEEAFYTLDKAPTYLPLHILIGELLLQQGKNQEAVNKFSQAASLYNLRGEAKQGIAMLERVTQMTPLNLKIRNQLVDLLISQGQLLPAAEQLKKIADIHYQLAELDNARQAYAEAIRLIQHSKTDRSYLVDLLYRKADIDLQRLDLRQAMRVYEQIRTIEPQDSRARIKLIDLYFRLGQDNAAITELDGYITLLENSGKGQITIKFLQDLVNEIPDKLEIRKRLADLLIHQGNISAAVEQLDFIADALLNMGNREAALRILKSIISLNPPNVQDYRNAYQQLSQN